MAKFGVGQAITRKEDERFLTGKGRYTDDISLDGQAWGHVLRSPHAHAAFRIVDTATARSAPGVIAVYTVDDLLADDIGPIPSRVPVKNRDGSTNVAPPHHALARDVVRHVGDGIAFVVAETADQARDAAELIEIEFDERPAVIDLRRAVETDAPRVWDEAPANTCFDWELGDREKTEAAFAGAARVVTLTMVHNRLVVNSMEPRTAIGDYDADGDRLILYTTSQGSHSLKGFLSDDIFNVPAEKVRVVTPDVGGGFGMKLFLYPEHILTVYAARKLRRPVRWTADRGEDFVTDTQGRAHITDASLALDADGRILGLKVENLSDLGAYLSNFATFVATMAGTPMVPGVYDVPTAYVRVRGLFTSTVPVDAYRGAGRPEAAYVIERLIDAAGRETGLGQAEIRRRNYIRPDQLPYTTPTGYTYDSGEFAENLSKAMALADWDGVAARRREAAGRNAVLGVGIAHYIESCGGGGPESAEVSVGSDGEVTVKIGTQSNGQGHETAYSQLVSEHLDIPLERIRVIQGDTDVVATGSGTGGSRSLPVGGAALDKAAAAVVEKGRRLAAHALEAAAADIEYAEGRFTIAGTDRSISLWDVAAVAADDARRPSDEEPGLDAGGIHKPPTFTFPHGAHICELEIDLDTGTPRITRYTVVDDFGRTINPLLLLGQIQGGVAQGIGQALYEDCIYDPESGQLLTGSYMDYCMPRADDLPKIIFEMHNVPCTTNPLGIKGSGEAGAIGAPPAVINAILDALEPYGVTAIDMPATEQKLWQLVRAGRQPMAAE